MSWSFALSLAHLWLLFAAPSSAPAATVELRVTSNGEPGSAVVEQRLARRLDDRLLEDGYRVVPVGEPAHVRVWIHLDGGGARIEAWGVDHRIERVDAGAPGLVALEVQQLTTVLVDALRPAATEPALGVIIEFGPGFDRDDLGAPGDGAQVQALREHLQVGLLERGFALTRRAAAEDTRLCVGGDLDQIWLTVVAGDQACAADLGEPIESQPEDAAEDQRAHLIAAAALALETWTPPAPAPVRDLGPAVEDPAPPVEPPPVAVHPAPPRSARVKPATSLSLSASAGLAVRAPHVDPLVSVRARGGAARGPGGGLDLALVPSRGPDLTVNALIPAAVVDWRIPAGALALVELGLLGGAHVHSYHQTASGGQRGVRVGPSVGASARVSYRGRRGLMVLAGVRAGWSGGRWIHVVDASPSWQRSGLLLGLELGLGWDIELGGRARG